MTVDSFVCGRCPVRSQGWFSALGETDWNVLREAATSHFYERGTTLHHAGAPADNLFCLQSGLVKLYRSAESGRQVLFRLIHPGETPGLVSIVNGREYVSTAQALVPTRACIIPRGVFLEVLGRSRELSAQLLQVLARELLRREDALAVHLLQPLPQRVAKLILQLRAGGPGDTGAPAGLEFDLPLKRLELAEMLATSPESLSRILTRFSGEGLVSIARSRVEILDLPRLQALAKGQEG